MTDKQLYHEYEEEGFTIKLYAGYFDEEHPDHLWAEFWESEESPRETFAISTHDKETLSYCASVFWAGYQNGEVDGIRSVTETLIDMLQKFLLERRAHENKET